MKQIRSFFLYLGKIQEGVGPSVKPSKSAQILYFKLLDSWILAGNPDEFSPDRTDVCRFIGMSDRTYYASLEALKVHGLLQIRTEKQKHILSFPDLGAETSETKCNEMGVEWNGL